MVSWNTILRSALGVLSAVVALLWAVKAYRDAHYFDSYDPRAPLNVAMIERSQVNKSQISPRCVYFQNGRCDVLVPASAGKALQDAAKEPKKITWYESDHVGINLEHTKRVLEDGLRWLLELDDPFRAPEERVTNLPLLAGFSPQARA